MERLTCYESILYQLLVFNYATKKSLLLLNFSKDAIYRAVERGLEERTISDGRMTYNIKGVSRKHQLTYLTITPIGIEYLKQKCSHKIQWLSNLSVEDSERVQIKGTRFSTNYAERFLRSTVSMQMAVEAGISGKMMFIVRSEEEMEKSVLASKQKMDTDEQSDRWWLDDIESILGEDGADNDEDDYEEEECEAEYEVVTCAADDGTPLMKMIMEATNGNITIRNRGEKKDGPIFYSSDEVKRVELSTLSEERKKQAARGLMMCRLSGLLIGCFHSYIVYLANANGMDWHEHIVSKEITLKNGFSRNANRAGTISQQNNGILIVKNAKDLADIYSDKLKRRKRKEYLGKGLDHLYVLTLDRKGVAQMRTLAETDVDAEEMDIIEAAVESGIYTKNTDVSAKLFPLKTKDGLLISVGTIMDIRRVDTLKAVSEKTQVEYGILCEEWQIPYYEAMEQDVKYMTVS